jgi:hypothetical protein
MKLRYAPRAKADIAEIHAYIGRSKSQSRNGGDTPPQSGAPSGPHMKSAHAACLVNATLARSCRVQGSQDNLRKSIAE